MDKQQPALLARPGEQGAFSSSYGSASTVGGSHEACRHNRSRSKLMHIIDIDTSGVKPADALTHKKLSLDELVSHGPLEIMRGVPAHRADLRWIHLRANCMSWVQELMAKVCEERGLEAGQHDPTGHFVKNAVLRKDLWKNLFHGEWSDHVQTRFMNPLCTSFSLDIGDEESDSNGSTVGTRDNLVLFLPFLHWDSSASWEQRQQMINDVIHERRPKDQADADLFYEYLLHKSGPLHDRRTLENAYYHDFGMTRSLPNYQQIMQRYTSRIRKDEEKLIVVDQLWLWVIKGTTITKGGKDINVPDTVITAFPDRLNDEPDSANVFNNVVQQMARGLQPPLRTANDLVALIIEHSTGVFFQRQLHKEMWFLEFFAAAIGIIRDKQKQAFRKFCQSTHDLEELELRKASLVEVAQKLEDRNFSIAIETALFGEIKDIIDELNCVDYILHRQEDVVKSLTRMQKSGAIRNVAEIVTERRASWAAVAQTARATCTDIESQMNLKQQHASLSETKTSRYQAEDSARQGRVMLLFTVVTIIFLPMSFLTSWFGMNINDPESGNLSLAQIAAIVFPISTLIAVIALVIAFNQGLRSSISGCITWCRDFCLKLISRDPRRQHSLQSWQKKDDDFSRLSKLKRRISPGESSKSDSSGNIV